MRSLMLSLAFHGLLVSAPEEAPAPGTARDDWPSFRGGPQLTGRREGRISDSPRLLWTFDSKTQIESTAALVGGKVLVGTAEAGLLALDLKATEKTGKEIWRAKTEAGIRSSPGVQGGRAYFGDDKGIFHSVELKSGKEVWSFATEGGEIVSSANFKGDAVLFGSYDSYLYCLSTEDGKLRWKYQTQGQVHSTPAVAELDTFVAGCDERLRAIDIATGDEVSELEMGAYSGASPAVVGDRLYVGTFGSEFLCVGWKERKILWTYEPPKGKFPFYSSPAVGSLGAGQDEIVVVGGRDKLIHALSTKDGKLLWSFPTKARVDASPVVIGRRVLVASLDGSLYLLDLATGEAVWKFTAGSPFAASPAVADEKLVISSQDGLVYCFDLKP